MNVKPAVFITNHNNKYCCLNVYVLIASFTAQDAIKRSTVDVSVTVYSPGTTFIVFDPASYSRSVTESVIRNTVVFTASARGPSGIQYSIVGGNTDNAFGINQNGQVFVNGPLDREAKETYNLIIRAEASSLAAEAPATIRIGDENDTPPRITFLEKEPKNIAIEDYSPAGSYVIKVNFAKLFFAIFY